MGDINPPPVHGDRAFDLATLAFYVYDAGELRRPVLARLASLASRAAVRAYLAHMVLRQVEWSARHYPAAPATRHHLRLARLVLQPRPWRALITRTNRCAVLIGAIGLYPNPGERAPTRITTLLDQAAHAGELVGAW